MRDEKATKCTKNEKRQGVNTSLAELSLNTNGLNYFI